MNVITVNITIVYSNNQCGTVITQATSLFWRSFAAMFSDLIYCHYNPVIIINIIIILVINIHIVFLLSLTAPALHKCLLIS